ncbi:MAG TPA: 2-C-methyl-D-erythritol 2,4-cyclodiphosphate synthase [Clostridiales bacterium]|nr:2-C-methyl-D-erythritol 2,4-cyclodiphosphate synthase [Clostridiales bacterium]
MKRIAIIAAAGKGTRAGADKIWMDMGGKLMIERTLSAFLSCPEVDQVILVVAKERLKDAEALLSCARKPCLAVVGGDTRTQSVRLALLRAKQEAGEQAALVAVHDGARPYVTPALIKACFDTAEKTGSAVPVTPSVDSLRRKTETGSQAISREEVLCVQTPQCFTLSSLLGAFSHEEEASDEATLYEKYVAPVTLVEGDPKNRKITYLSDIYEQSEPRVGVGFDVHELRVGRPLVLGGVIIKHDKGVYGHSDADVPVHAIMDALLTAANLPDIGHLFPPDDPQYEGADSIKLLQQVAEKVKEVGWRPVNVSAEIMAEKPKLAPYLSQMERNVAQAIGISENRVKFAATTTETLGIVGEEKGIAAHAVALLAPRKD